jgi:hypothetical protein
MDFSFNKLSGPLPRSIEKLGKLRHLNVSYNNLTGEIPSSAVYRKLNFTSFLGNAALEKGVGPVTSRVRRLKHPTRK